MNAFVSSSNMLIVRPVFRNGKLLCDCHLDLRSGNGRYDHVCVAGWINGKEPLDGGLKGYDLAMASCNPIDGGLTFLHFLRSKDLSLLALE